MPINIIDYTNSRGEKKGETIDYLCDNEWEMPVQIETLEKWLLKNRNKLPKGNYIADLGFSPREDAAGGGCVIKTEAMEAMLKIGLELHLSEYPPFEDK